MESDLEYEVVWSGGPLLPPRDERPSAAWNVNSENKRKYTHKQNPQPEAGGQPKTETSNG